MTATDREIMHALAPIAQKFRADNPTLETVVDPHGIWFTHEGVDYGVYGTAPGSRGRTVDIVRVWEDGRTVLHRPATSAARAKAWREAGASAADAEDAGSWEVGS